MDTKIKLELGFDEIYAILCAISTLIHDREDMLSNTSCEEEIEDYKNQIEELNSVYQKVFDTAIKGTLNKT